MRYLTESQILLARKSVCVFFFCFLIFYIIFIWTVIEETGAQIRSLV